MKFIRSISYFSITKSLIVGIVLTAGYYYWYFDDGTNLKQQIVAVEAQVRIEEAKKKETEATIKKEDEMQANLAALARDLQVVKAKLPSELLDTELTGIINRAAIRSRINITSLARKRGAGATQAKVLGSESVEEVVFDINIESPFNHFVQFIDQLAKEEKIVKIRDFSIERNLAAVAEPQIKFRGEIIGFKQAPVTK